MANSPLRLRARTQPSATSRRRVALREKLFSGVSEEELWSRARFTGFTTVPRTLSIIMRIIDSLDAKNASRVYLDLWMRAFDDYFIDVRDEYEFAYSSGYSGQRGVRSWRERVAVLRQRGFIRATKTPEGRYRHILLLDPHPVVEKLAGQRLVSEEDVFALQSYMLSIGAIQEL